jgi:hypothetical protein
MQEKCYFGDMENPVADVAAQAASGLALISRVLVKHGTPAEQAIAGMLFRLCSIAHQTQKFGHHATPTENTTGNNLCIMKTTFLHIV